MDLFAEIIVSLLPVMMVCRLAVSKSCTERSGVDIVLIRGPWGISICGITVFVLLARPKQQMFDAIFQMKMVSEFSKRQYRGPGVRQQ